MKQTESLEINTYIYSQLTKKSRILSGERTVSSVIGARKNWIFIGKRMKLDFSLTTTIKINLKRIKD